MVAESTDIVCASSAVDSPAAGIATSPPKVMVVSALDPDVIIVVRHNVKLVGGQSLRLITCVRVWYTILRISLLPSDELVINTIVVALPLNVTGTLCRQTRSTPFTASGLSPIVSVQEGSTHWIMAVGSLTSAESLVGLSQTPVCGAVDDLDSVDVILPSLVTNIW